MIDAIKSAIDAIKSAFDIAKKINNIELQQNLFEVQNQMMAIQKELQDAHNENQELRHENDNLRRQLETKENVTYYKSFVYDKSNLQNIMPCCPYCLENKVKLMPVVPVVGRGYQCGSCKFVFKSIPTKEEVEKFLREGE